MNLNTASVFFKNLITETDKKSEIRVYQKFIAILSGLENKGLTDEQLQSIEKDLDALNLNAITENRKKHFKRKLNHFEKFLKERFSLVHEGYYTAIGMTLGMCCGVAFGAFFLNVSYGLVIGMLFGLFIGAALDTKAKKEGKVL